MSKKQNNLFIVILFTIIWIVRPIYPQENSVGVDSSSLSTQTNEFEFLESTTLLKR